MAAAQVAKRFRICVFSIGLRSRPYSNNSPLQLFRPAGRLRSLSPASARYVGPAQQQYRARRGARALRVFTQHKAQRWRQGLCRRGLGWRGTTVTPRQQAVPELVEMLKDLRGRLDFGPRGGIGGQGCAQLGAQRSSGFPYGLLRRAQVCIARGRHARRRSKLLPSLVKSRMPIRFLLVRSHANVGLPAAELLDRANPGGRRCTDFRRERKRSSI